MKPVPNPVSDEVADPPVSILTRLARAADSINGARKDSVNSIFSSPYCSLNSILAVVKPALREQGLVLLQPFDVMPQEHLPQEFFVRVQNNFINLETGEELIFGTDWPIICREAHVIGSAVSYARRYSLTSLLGIEAHEDDGNAASPGAADRAKAQREARGPAKEVLKDPNAEAALAGEKRRPGRAPKAETSVPAAEAPKAETFPEKAGESVGVPPAAEKPAPEPPKSDVTSLEATAPGARKPAEAAPAVAPAPETPKAEAAPAAAPAVETPKTEAKPEDPDEAWLGLSLPATLMDHVPQGGLEWRKRYGTARVDEIAIKDPKTGKVDWDLKGIKWMLLHRPGGSKHPTLAMQPDHAAAWSGVMRLAKELGIS